MAEQSPSVEIAPTIIISNSDEDNDNAGTNSSEGSSAHSGESIEQNSGDELASSLGDDNSSQSEQVVIAAIEAERDVALAEIHSDVERERIAVEAERIETVSDTSEELEACRRELAALAAKVETLENLLIPPPQLVEEIIAEELETAPEPNLIQPSIAAPTVEQSLENSEENQEEEAEEIIPNRVLRFIAI